jgi:hypothetical protein
MAIDEKDELTFIDISDQEPEEEETEVMKKLSAFHVVFLVVVLAVIVIVAVRIRTWGTRVQLTDLDQLEVEVQADSYDHIMPLVDENGYKVTQDVKRILVFGNSYFAEDRDSEDGMAALLAAGTGAEVINCSITGSYVATASNVYDANTDPMDAFSPYWLILQLYTGYYDDYKNQAAAAMGDALPPEGTEVYDTLLDLDMDTVDVAVFMYDMSDYFMDHRYIDDEDHHNMTTVCGNMQASIELFRMIYPNVRVIVMSPTYAFYVNESGEYEDAELHRNSWGPASDYFLFLATTCSNELNVTFVDNYFTTFNADNASNYLEDNMHVNQAGRELLTKRLIYAINYYND